MTWIDGLVLVTLAIAFYAGWRNGLVPEFFDAGAIAVGTWLAVIWSPGFALGLPPTWPLSDAARHLMAFWLVFLIVFVVIRVAGWAATTYSKWPGSHWINGVGGGIISMLKVLAALFVILYLALFLPIDPQIRDTLRKSPVAILFDKRFPPINDAIVSLAPRYYKLIVRPIMHDHRI